LLLEAGARDDTAEPPRDWRSLELPKGLLVRPGLLYRGFRRVLVGLRKSFDARLHLTPTACPLAIAEMFDKTATCRKLDAAEVPIPEMLDDPTELTRPIDAASINFHRPRPRLPNDWPTMYVKLNTGSSATGIVVLRVEDRSISGTTTLANIDGAFYNSRLVRRLIGVELSTAVEYIVNEGAIAQRGIPMGQIDGQNFDV